jgi:hypothetical protein
LPSPRESRAMAARSASDDSWADVPGGGGEGTVTSVRES